MKYYGWKLAGTPYKYVLTTNGQHETWSFRLISNANYIACRLQYGTLAEYHVLLANSYMPFQSEHCPQCSTRVT